MAAGPGENAPTTVVQSSETSGLGTAGFIVSLVGLVSCGLLSPIGMVLSFCGMKKQPNGLAIAGFVIGLIGTLLVILSVVVFALMFIYMKEAIAPVYERIEQLERTADARSMIDSFAEENGRLPTEQEANKMFAERGPAGNSLLFEPGQHGAYDIRDIGPDGEFDTADDYVGHGFAIIPTDDEE